MAGCKAFTNEEINLVVDCLSNIRNRTLFILGVKTGYRITELLSLTVKDVLNLDGSVVDRIRVYKRNMKGQTESREVVLHHDARIALAQYLETIKDQPLDTALFKSRQGTGPITRQQAHNVLKEAFNKAMVKGSTGTHSMRKSFAKRVYEYLERDLVATQRALGHKSILSTVNYLAVDQETIDQAVLSV